MINKNLLIAGALVAGFMSTGAQAQSTAPAKAPAATEAAVKLPTPHWRASKLIGVKIYNEQNERLGDINEIIVDQTGKTLGYVIGVGGFLGMGEHDIFVEPSKIKFVNEPVRAAAAPAANTAPATKDNAMTTRPASNTQARTATEIWYPDHGLLSATKEQLKALPQFKYSNYN
jgi:sporulation protein YlmC with PRC-barrel domain